MRKMIEILGKCGKDNCDKIKYAANRCIEHYDEEITQLRKWKRIQYEVV